MTVITTSDSYYYYLNKGLSLELLSKQSFSISRATCIRAVEDFMCVNETMPTDMPISAVGNGAMWAWVIVPCLAYWR